MLPFLLLLVAATAQAQVIDLEGRPVDPLQASPGSRGTALVFTTTDCPIANRYAPEINKLREAYAAQGISFWLVYVNPRETEDRVRAHAAKFDYRFAILRDPQHHLVKRLGIRVTPEVAVLGSGGNLLYHGRIDDRHIEVGVDRPAPTRRDFADALEALVSGRHVAVRHAPAVGCVIADFEPVTYAQHVAPILSAKCSSCHRPGGPAPFSLTSYREARARASLIADVTARRFMPPYNATSDVGTFVGQARLTLEEIATLRQWADGGTPLGTFENAPPAPPHARQWQLGTPDLVVTPEEPFTLQPEPADVFRIFVIRLPLTGTKYVTGLEFLPGNAQVVHHANIRLDRTAGSRDLDARDPAPGYDGLLARSAVYPEGHFLGWTPGQVAPLVPPDLAWRLDPGTDLVVQLHMLPSGARETVQPMIGFYFSDKPPSRTPTILRLGSQGIDIPPGEKEYVVRDAYVLPADVQLHAVQPHAHYRLREARGTATLPDGTTRTLIAIDRWDFRWQHVYRYRQPVPLPRGTRLAMEYRYDNSADNPRNPQLPPQRVFWGQGSFDEMGDLWFQFVADREADRERLRAEVSQKMTAEDVIGYETMLRANPQDAELHDDVALLYLSLGRAAEAVEHFSASAAINPARASAHFNLATALSVAGRLDEALGAYQRALALRPDYAAAHNNLGSVLAAQGRVPEAITHFREAARADRTNVQAHRNLAWHLATAPRLPQAARAEAVAAGEHAAELTGYADPHVLDALTAAYEAAGLADKAAAAAARARRLRNPG